MNDDTPTSENVQQLKAPHLLEEPPILVYPTLAVYMGINKAVVFQQLHFLQNNQKTAKNEHNFIENKYWVYNSYQQWKDQYFPWLSVSTLKGIFIELESIDKLILSRQSVKKKSDRRKWYTIDYEAWVTFCSTMRQKMSYGSSDKKCPMVGQKMSDVSSETSSEVSSETSSDTKDSIAPNGTSAPQSPAALTYININEQPEIIAAVARLEYSLKQKLLPSTIEEKASPPATVAIPPTPSSGAPPIPDVFNMTCLRDVIAVRSFRFKRPSQLELKSYKPDKRRLGELVDVAIDTFPGLCDSERVTKVAAFYDYWSVKVINGTPAQMPVNAASFGRQLRTWLAEHPEVEATTTSVFQSFGTRKVA